MPAELLSDTEFIEYVEQVLKKKGRLNLNNIKIDGIPTTPPQLLEEMRAHTAFGLQMLGVLRNMHAQGQLE